MTKSYAWNERLGDVEQMIFRAKDYVQASEELRPRVLETAHAQHGERRVRRLVCAMSLLVFLGALCSPSNHDAFDAWKTGQRISWLGPDPDLAFSALAPRTGSQSDEAAWKMVDSFSVFRLRQIDALRMAF